MDVPYIAIAIAFIFIVWFLLRNKTYKNVRLAPPPVAPGGWPIIGHLHLLAGGARLPHVTLGELADRCGPIFTIRLGMHRAVVVSSWEMARECYAAHDASLSSRPEFAGAKYLTYGYAMFAFTPYGAYWREIRKIATLELLSSRRVERLGCVRASEVGMLVEGLRELWRDGRDASGRVLVEVKERLSNMSLNIIVRAVAGKRYETSATRVGGDDAVEKRRCQTAMREFFEFLGMSVASDAIPMLEWLDIGGHIKRMKRTARELDSILGEWLAEHREKRATGREEQDFMDAMISAVQGTELAGYDDDTIIKSTCLAMIAGAADTSTVTLTWAISLLINNPHTLKKAQDELDTVVGKERPVSESDISKLVYLQVVVKESLRLYSPTPLLAPRIFTDDCSVGGYHIPKGTRMIPNAWKIHNDPRVWSDPSEFKPERFLSGPHKDIDMVKGQHFHFIPFGSGRRGCPGATFGLQVVHLALASFLHAFEISTLDNARVDMTESFGLTNMKATPLEVLIKPRVDSFIA